MATNKKHNRNHGHKAQRAFPDQHAEARLANCFYRIDGQYTNKADVALAARRAGREVSVIPQLRAIGRAVPPDEQVEVDDLPQQTPTD